MTYNIYKGAIGREKGLLALIRSIQPDLLFLQEVGDITTMHPLAEAVGMELAFSKSYYGPKNLALLSRYPFTQQASYRAFPLFHSLLLATIQLPSALPLHLYGVHVGVLHDGWRVLEIRAILQQIQRWETAHPSAYALIAGDFNAILPGDGVNLRIGTPLHRFILALAYRWGIRIAPRLLAKAGWQDSYRAIHPADPGFTFPATARAVRLDHIYLTPPLLPHLRNAFVVTDPESLTKSVSDHLPLVVDLEIG